jgi:hypothetical protein
LTKCKLPMEGGSMGLGIFLERYSLKPSYLGMRGCLLF